MSTVSLCYSWECEEIKNFPDVKLSNAQDDDSNEEVSDEETDPVLFLVEI